MSILKMKCASHFEPQWQMHVGERQPLKWVETGSPYAGIGRVGPQCSGPPIRAVFHDY